MGSQDTIYTLIHTFGKFSVAHPPIGMHQHVRLKESGEPSGNTHTHMENCENYTQAQVQVRTWSPGAVR